MRKYSILFFLVMFLIGTDTFLISPLLPILGARFAVATGSTGWMMSAYAFGFAIFALIAGPLSDNLDRKKVMMLGLAGFALTTLACGFAWNFTSMVTFRALNGVFGAFVTPQVLAAIPMVAPRDRIVKMIGYAMAGLAIANVIGVPLGTFLAGISWNFSFFALAGVSLLMLILIAALLPALPAQEVSGEKESVLKIYASIFKSWKTIAYLLGFGLIFIGTSSIFVFLSTWYIRDFHLSISFVGIALLFGGLGQFIGSLIGSYITKALGNKLSLALSFIIWIALLIALPFSVSIYMAIPILVAFYIINGIIVPVLVASIQQSITGNVGTTSSMSNFFLYMGQALGGALAGSMFASFPGYFGVSFFAAAMFALGGLFYIIGGFWRKNKAVAAQNA